MAGRGIRPGGIRSNTDGYVKKPAKPFVPHNSDINIDTVVNKINEINVTDVNPKTLSEARVLFAQYMSKNEKPSDKIFLRFHSEALNDSSFGEKFAIFFREVKDVVIDDMSVRTPVLTNLQKDYENRDALLNTDNDKFLNAVMLLGNVNKFLKISNKGLEVFVGPLFDYLDLLLQGEEEKFFRVLTAQITLFGSDPESRNFNDRYELLQVNLRKALIERNLNKRSKCWIMLALDYISNNMQPLNGALKNFYLENLGDDYSNLELRLKCFGKLQDPTPAPESSAAMNLVRRRILASEMQKASDVNNDIFEMIGHLKVDEGNAPSARGLSNSKSEMNENQSFDVTNVKDDNDNDDKLKKRRPKLNQKKNPRARPANYDNKDGDDNDDASDEDEKELYGIQIEKDRSTRGSFRKSDFNTNPSSTPESKEVSDSNQDKSTEWKAS